MININGKIIKPGDTIKAHGKEYLYFITEDGKNALKRYNEKTKMWIELHFADEQDPKMEERLIKMLSQEYIRKAIEKNKCD